MPRTGRASPAARSLLPVSESRALALPVVRAAPRPGSRKVRPAAAFRAVAPAPWLMRCVVAGRRRSDAGIFSPDRRAPQAPVIAPLARAARETITFEFR